MRPPAATFIAFVSSLLCASASANPTCTLSGPLKVPTEAAFGPKRTIWKTLPKGTVLEIKGRDRAGVDVEGGGVVSKVNAAVLDDVCALPIEPLDVPTPPPPPAAPAPPPPTPHFAERARVVVLGVQGPALADDARRAADAAMLLEARRDTHIEVLGPEDASAVIERSVLVKAQRCDEAPCVEAAASAFGAHQALTAVVDGNQLHMALLDVVNGRVLNRVTRDASSGLEEAVRASTAAVYGVTGHIRLSQQPPGALVTVDGALAGSAPVGDLAVTKPGPHTLVVSGPGLLSWQTSVDVRGGADVDVVVGARSVAALEDEQLGWRISAGALGVGGLVAATASVLFYSAAVASDARLDAVGHKATQAQLDAITGETFADFMGSVALGTTSVALVGGGVAAWFLNPATRTLE